MFSTPPCTFVMLVLSYVGKYSYAILFYMLCLMVLAAIAAMWAISCICDCVCVFVQDLT